MKPWWKSKTFWVNIATGGLSLALQQDSPEQLATLLALANLVLRFFTTEPIGRCANGSPKPGGRRSAAAPPPPPPTTDISRPLTCACSLTAGLNRGRVLGANGAATGKQRCP